MEFTFEKIGHFVIIQPADDTYRSINFLHLCGNGRRFACREICRMCRKLHIVYSTNHFDSVTVFLYTRKDRNRYEELCKWLSGKTFNHRCLNNGYWMKNHYGI